MARIISHLGERLISSDKVALLELIKNAYDAKSKLLNITIDQFERTMVIYDEGHGMDDETLRDHWLVIGTSNRLSDKEKIDKSNVDIPLGEKGLGRFSTMRLGNYLIIETTTNNSDYIWKLEIDWRDYSYDSNKFLDEIETELEKLPKPENTESFTRITIKGLKEFIGEDWDDKGIEDFILETANKYVNPFVSLPRPFEIKINLIDHRKRRVRSKLGEEDALLFNQAHHEIEGFYKDGKINFGYVIRRKGEIIESKRGEILIDQKIKEVRVDKDGYVGEFNFHIYMFNRRRLNEINGFLNRKALTAALDRYTGGPMIFRDGFRIFPYGEQGDDWLDLNKQKFRRGGVSIIGEQTAGYIAINSNSSPFLVDQTNREGLVRNKSYNNFKSIVQNVFTTLLEALRRNEPKVTSNKIADNAKKSAKIIETTIHKIYKSGDINLEDAKKIVRNSRKIEKGFIELERRERAMVEMAAIGMTSVQIAHEVHNFINKILSVMYDLKIKRNEKSDVDFDLLELNLKSLRTMISQIDDQAVTIRRTKSTVNLVKEIQGIAAGMQIVAKKYMTPTNIIVRSQVDNLNVKVNKGLINQLFDNLILNSLYWIDSLKPSDGGTEGIIQIEILDDGIIKFQDNGPGISKVDAEAIFEPFFSRKEDGRGLGLFISREIAAFHNIQITLTSQVNSLNRYHCFQLNFSKIMED
ncbi:sensor histidine kinase [Paenibacillus pabuli]|uniref:sensor histidine kinase n=1 Tax=Paenibacillus pabuli TaxID=1472 RepID=UPI001FFF4645|nr:ATP-binding protein [Paenibacillus pabuli]UPK44728.1 ATP-binding protein [Paenibacillus pabuli]